jgi:hypothetical protein
LFLFAKEEITADTDTEAVHRLAERVGLYCPIRYRRKGGNGASRLAGTAININNEPNKFNISMT